MNHVHCREWFASQDSIADSVGCASELHHLLFSMLMGTSQVYSDQQFGECDAAAAFLRRKMEAINAGSEVMKSPNVSVTLYPFMMIWSRRFENIDIKITDVEIH